MRYKKLITICEGINKKNLDLLYYAIRTSNDGQAVNILQSLYSELRSQPVALSVEAFEYNVRIHKYLQEICEDLAGKYYTVANYRIKKLQEELSKRSRLVGDRPLMTKKDLKKDKITEKAINEYAKKGGFDLSRRIPVGELYSDRDLYDIMVAQLQDEVNGIQNEINGLSDSNAPQYIEYQKSQLAFKLSEVQQKLSMYCDEGKREAYIAAMARITEKDKELISGRKYGEEQAKVIEAQYNDVMQRRDDEKKHLQSGMEAFLNHGNVNSDSVKSTPKVDNSGEINKLNDAIKFAKQEQEKLIEKLDSYKEEIKEAEAKLKKLLIAREDQTAAECEIDDAKIIAIASERKRLLLEIKSCNQELSVLTNKLIMFQSNQSLLETQKRSSQLDSLLGIDVSEIAVSLNELIKKGNDKKQEVDDAYAAAYSTEIETDTFTKGTMNIDSATGKDIGKFDDLRLQLNMGKAER